ncbi:acyl-CoA thioesterase [Aquabacterium sp. A7-Y]|uniref:acyl-CoA thioesterase n=1 Tax=Aquabacterium sp. A7-Y TaxID=1349605 RepID=UPI00223CE5CA|nr:thioesterase family protein [Aquabacterium sp. A7-Y]MCW7541823.1 acyl-CoA thioesterase [Aquabacterium sp. A7-Y]
MRIDIPEDKKLVHETRISIRWGDMDAMGHVNNAVYFRYMEMVRLDWMMTLGTGPNPAAQGPVIANAFCNFHRQLEFPGELVAKLYVGNAGRSSFDTFFTLERADAPGVICAAGGATTVWVDFPLQKSVPLPDSMRAAVS